MDFVEEIGRLSGVFSARSWIPRDLGPVTDRGHEAPLSRLRVRRRAIESVWHRVEGLYRSGVNPGIQLCVRYRGEVALDRAIGHARGNAPHDPRDGPKIEMKTDTPVNVFSAAKAITAMVVHKLDEQNRLHLDDRVCEFIPGFERHGKGSITIRHLLAHRAGIPNVPPESMNLELLSDPERLVQLLCDSRPRMRPGRLLAYHAVTGGFLLAEIVRRATGSSIREVLESEIRTPLGLRWLHYGVDSEDLDRVALNAATGPPIPPPLSWILDRALGAPLPEVVELSNDPRFLTGLVPSANLITTARDIATFYQCLLDEGELGGVRVFEPRTLHHAIDEQSAWELDLTLMLPIGYSLGFMLGNQYLSPFGWNHPRAFGHLGLSNVFCWADPERELVVSLITTGKPVASLHMIPLVQLIAEIHDCFPPVRRRSARAASSRLVGRSLSLV